jgi:hypothetical protein
MSDLLIEIPGHIEAQAGKVKGSNLQLVVSNSIEESG